MSSSRALQMEGYVRAEVASDTLVALSRNHFSLVMYELQHHLKPLNLTEEFVIVTLAKLANGNGRARRDWAPASARRATPLPLPWCPRPPPPISPSSGLPLAFLRLASGVSPALWAAEIPSLCPPSCVFSPASPSLARLSFLLPLWPRSLHHSLPPSLLSPLHAPRSTQAVRQAVGRG